MDLLLLILVVITATMSAFASMIKMKGERITIVERLDRIARDELADYSGPEFNQPLKKRLTFFFKRWSFWFTGKFVNKETMSLYEGKLNAAGYPLGLSTEGFIAFKYSVLVISLLLGALSKNLLIFFAMAGIGFILPNFILKKSEKKRKELIIKDLPDILDLLSVSVEAGLGFDQAIQKVVEKSSGPLSDEFEKTLQEINMGKPRREALRDMGKRVNVDDVTVFLSAIVQADQLGVSISNVLRLQSKQGRTNRRMRAEEKAQKLPIKILIPLVVFVFPCILIVLLGPAVPKLLQMM